MDITSVALLSMFGSAAVGGLIGFVVGKITRFELGMTVGLLIFGGVTLGFAWRCFEEYRAFATAGPNAVWGEVVHIVDKPSNESGSITSPAPIVKFSGPDGKDYLIEGPTASGAKVGEHVNVILDPGEPERSRVGRIGDLRGGAIAFMLFGTFPISFAVVMIAQVLEDTRSQRARAIAPRAGKRLPARAEKGRGAAVSLGHHSRFGITSAKLLYAALFCSIIWIGMDGAPLLERFTQGFVGITASLVGYALWGALVARLGLVWIVGVLMLALNFGVWAFALDLLG